MIYINDQIDQIDLEKTLSIIPSQRREQALRYKHELGRRLCVAAYMLLTEALRAEFGITEYPVFEYGPHDKPSILGHPDIHFNLSHCREAAACVVARHPVGIDIESIGRYKDSLLHYTMNETEVEAIKRATQPDMEFVRYWTMKEALLKKSGEGIRNDMKKVLTGDEPFVTIVNQARGYICTATI